MASAMASLMVAVTVHVAPQAAWILACKSVTFVIGGGAGIALDAFARTLARDLAQQMPGAPKSDIMRVFNPGICQFLVTEMAVHR